MRKRTALHRTYHPNGFVHTEQTVQLIKDNYEKRTVIGRKGKHKGLPKTVLGDLVSVDCKTEDGERIVCPIDSLTFGKKNVL